MTLFAHWLPQARPGEEFSYHHGGNLSGCRATLLQEVRLAYDRGEVILVQRRDLSDRELDYLAIKRARVRVPRIKFFPTKED